MAGLAQLLVYVCYVYGLSIKEDIPFCKPLENRITGEDIFKVVDSFVTSNVVGGQDVMVSVLKDSLTA